MGKMMDMHMKLWLGLALLATACTREGGPSKKALEAVDLLVGRYRLVELTFDGPLMDLGNDGIVLPSFREEVEATGWSGPVGELDTFDASIRPPKEGLEGRGSFHIITSRYPLHWENVTTRSGYLELADLPVRYEVDGDGTVRLHSDGFHFEGGDSSWREIVDQVEITLLSGRDLVITADVEFVDFAAHEVVTGQTTQRYRNVSPKPWLGQ